MQQVTAQRTTRGYPTQGYRGGSNQSAAAGGFQSPTTKPANDVRGVIQKPANANPRLGANVKPVQRTFGQKVDTVINTPAGKFAMRTAARVARVHPLLRNAHTAYELYEHFKKGSVWSRPAEPAVRYGYIMAGWTLYRTCNSLTPHLWKDVGFSVADNCLSGQAGAFSGAAFDLSTAMLANRYTTSTGLTRWRTIETWVRNAGAPKPQATTRPDSPYVPPRRLPEGVVGLTPAFGPSIPWGLIPYRVTEPLSTRGNNLPGMRHKPNMRANPRARPMTRADRHRYQPPGRRTKETKTVARTPQVILAGLNTITEGLDLIDVAYKGLDPRIRARLQSGGNALTPWEKAKAVYNHFQWFSTERFAKALVANQLEDRFWGTLGQFAGKANKNIFTPTDRPFGAETGIHDTAFGDMLNEYREAENERREARGEEKLKPIDKLWALDFDARVNDVSGDLEKVWVSVTS